MGSTSPNSLAAVMPGAGSSFAVQSSDINQAVLQMTSVTLTPAQVITLFTAPIVLLPAPGAGLAYIIDYVVMKLVYGGTAYTGGGVSTISYVGGAAVCNTIPAANVTAGASATTTIVTGASNVATTLNAGIQIATATGNFATGNSPLQFIFYYSIV